MQTVKSLFEIVGSLGVFIYGMKVMSDGIQKSAGGRLQSILQFMTRNRFAALVTGFVITGLVQSSSATTVMVVGFVNAGLLSLSQAIGVIMGANIGTTVTGWIVAILGFKIKIAIIALPVIGIGLPLRLSARLGKQDLGEALTGFGLLFLGLDFLKQAVPNIQNNPEIFQFITNLNNIGPISFLVFVLFGTILTIVIQSSSAAMAITLTMAYSGWIDFPMAAAIVLGENIGTTATAYIVAIGTGVNARRASRAHLLFNVFGVLWMSALFKPFLLLTDAIIPGPISDGSITAHLAMFHTLFNLTNSFLLIGFVRHIEKLVIRLVKPKKGEDEAEYSLQYISTLIQDTPELNIVNAKLELSRMTEMVESMFDDYYVVFNNPEQKMGDVVRAIGNKEEFTDRMQEDISSFLADCARQSLSSRSTKNINSMIRIAHELENMGDSIFNLSVLAKRRYDKRIMLNPDAVSDLRPYIGVVREFITYIKTHLDNELTADEMETAFILENKTNKFRNLLRDQAQERLQEGAKVKSEILLIDIVRHVEHIGDACLNIAQALRQMR